MSWTWGGAVRHGGARVGDSVASFVVDATRFTIVAEPVAPRANLGSVARAMYNERRLRDQAAGIRLFGEPAWDILLDLFASEAEGKAVSVSSACLAASVPMTTALRWLARLEAEALVERSATGDRRRINVCLTAGGRDRVARTLGALLSAQKARPACAREPASR